MSNNIVLCDVDNVHSTIEELRQEWAIDILNKFGIHEINLDSIEDIQLTLAQIGLEIVNNISDKSIKVYKRELVKKSNGNEYYLPETDKDLIAEWNMPKFIKIIGIGEVYYELHLNEWSIFNIR